MATSQSKEFLDPKAIITITILTALWGFNYTAIKIHQRRNRSGLCLDPALLDRFDLWRDLLSPTGRETIPYRHYALSWIHGRTSLRLGVRVHLFWNALYGCRAFRGFCLYRPFVVAIGAHLFLRGDRLTFQKTMGLVLAFIGRLYRVSRKT